MITYFSWIFTFPKDKLAIFRIRDVASSLNLKILENMLMALDSSITDVVKSSDISDGYVIRSKNGDMFIQAGNVVSKNILSSGTKAGLDIAYLVTSMFQGIYDFFYCDEQFSFIHSDIEKTILSLIISLLKPNVQLFFTTHNLDVLEMNLPIHSFTFLKKKDNIEVVHPEKKLKDTHFSLKEAVQNDVFNISPDIEKILGIEFIN